MPSDTLTIVIAIGLTAIIMFVFPLMTMADRTDDISQMVVETEVTEFVNNIATVGQLTLDDYDKFVQDISSTGNAMTVEIQVDRSDPNGSKKTTQTNPSAIGTDEYTSEFTSQILRELDANNKIDLKEGDRILVKAYSKDTLATSLNNWFYKLSGNDVYAISAQHAAVVK